MCKAFARHDYCVSMELASSVPKVIDMWATFYFTVAAAKSCQIGDTKAMRSPDMTIALTRDLHYQFLRSLTCGPHEYAVAAATCCQVDDIEAGIGLIAGTYLHGVLVWPGLLAGAQLPQNDPKGVHITLLVVSLTAQHFRSSPLRCASLGFGAQPGAAPHP